MCIYMHVCSENVSETTGVIQFTVRNYGRRKEGTAHRGYETKCRFSVILPIKI